MVVHDRNPCISLCDATELVSSVSIPPLFPSDEVCVCGYAENNLPHGMHHTRASGIHHHENVNNLYCTADNVYGVNADGLVSHKLLR
jgi:hypothetical protein